MTTGVCSRCGRRGEVEYGSDGLPYCTACIFYGLNKQCWRCRMYLPASELQQYKGQWACPYCIQDMRDADRKATERTPEKPKVDAYIIPETCERCGRDLDNRVYIWNGRKLCLSCMNEEQEKWGLVGGGPMGAPYKVTIQPEKRRREASIFEAFIGTFLHLLGIRKKKKEIIIVEAKMPISRAKPMAEKAMQEKEGRRPQSEGIMALKPEKKEEPKKKPRKGKKKKTGKKGKPDKQQ